MPASERSMELPDYVADQMQRSAEISGRDIQLITIPGEGTRYVLDYADSQAPFHVLRVQSDCSEHYAHVCLMASAMIERVWSEQPARRYLAQTNWRELLPIDHHLALLEYNWITDPEALSTKIRSDLLSRLIDYPVQIRVAQAVLGRFPQHYEHFRKYALARTGKLQRPAASSLSPALRHKYDALDGAFKGAINDLIGGLGAEGCHSTDQVQPPSARLGADLLRVEFPGHRGDRQATNLWAKRLCMRFWYKWKRMR